MSTGDDDPFYEVFRKVSERTALASSIYDALKTGGRLKDLKPLVYRCPHRCALLELFDTPEGLVVGFPRYKTSPDVTVASSSESGRSKNTEDGDRRWKRHAAFAESVSNPPLSCDHLHNVALPDESIREDLASRHAEVTVRRDGTRFAVR